MSDLDSTEQSTTEMKEEHLLAECFTLLFVQLVIALEITKNISLGWSAGVSGVECWYW